MKSRILIVDDNDDIRVLLKRALSSSRFEIEEAVSGEEVLGKMDTFKPDLVLLDIIMPGIDGFTVCKAVRDAGSDTPVIFLSGRSDTADKVRGLECGGNDYITKPFDKAEVIARIDNQLKISTLTGELKSANKVLTEKQKILDDDLNAASGIQQSLLPHHVPDIENLIFGWRFVPCQTIGGDIFNIMRLDENHIGIYMIDVAGHGVPAALITVSVSQTLKPDGNGLTKERTYEAPGYRIVSPGALMESLDREYPIERFGRYFTIVYLIIDTTTGELTYSNAGHPEPVLIRKNGQVEILDKGGTIIGLGGLVPFEEGKTPLERGDRVVLLTDGILDCLNPDGELYGEERFYSTLRSVGRMRITELLDGVVDSITDFSRDRPFPDDISIIVIEYGQHGTTEKQRM
jgi:sigma-B regulation protein RsbU (phosphoserine phosphatase)